MKVVLIGAGGRENALAYKIAQSIKLSELFICPGNPGTEKYGKNITLKNDDQIVEFCLQNKIDLVVIGPEQPLVDGLADKLRDVNIAVFGPDKKAAIIEGDKSFSKELMLKYNIPTSKYASFNKETLDNALAYIQKSDFPLVIKASGLAAGKGVIICNNFAEAENCAKDMLTNNAFGKAGENIVIEEFLEGEEASIFAITDGTDFLVLPSAQDHKRVFDNDKGKNTGGMGAYSPAPLITKELEKKIIETIIKPTINAMNNEGRTFVGCLYCGLMINNGIAKVIEFNCRFGDPETQVVLPLLDGDFLELLYSSAIKKINKDAVNFSGGSALCVVLASGGYPDDYKSGYEIFGINEIEDKDVIVFHSGTKSVNNKILTSGGRVLGVTAKTNQNNLAECKNKCYNAVSKIKFNNMHYRKDIGDKGIKYY
ncbi:MAG: phosphoribosylamine--glycine ligase [bacterium]